MQKNQVHEWHENREREEGGGKRYFRARWDTRTWRFLKTEPEDEDWLPIDEPSTADYIALRDVLFRKYQRRRVPFKFIEHLDALLLERGVQPPTP